MVGHCQKQLGISDLKSSIWFHSNMFKCLHNYFSMFPLSNERRQKEERARYVKELQFYLLKSDLSYYRSYKKTFILSDYCFLVPQVGHLHSSEAPPWAICTRKLTSPWGICHNFEIRRPIPDKCWGWEVGSNRTFGIDGAIKSTIYRFSNLLGGLSAANAVLESGSFIFVFLALPLPGGYQRGCL